MYVYFLCFFRLLKSVTEIGQNRKVGSGYIVWQEVFDNEVKVSWADIKAVRKLGVCSS